MNTKLTDGKEPAPQVAEAYRLARTNQMDAAHKLCKKIVAKYPNTFQAIHLLGVIEYQAGNLPRATQLIRRAHQLAPDNTEILAHLAKILVEGGDDVAGLAAYEKLAALAPDTPGVYDKLAAGYRNTDALENGINFLKSTFQRASHIVAIPLQLSCLCREHGRLEEAQAFAEQALRMDPVSCHAALQLGGAFFKRKDYEAGIKTLEEGANSQTDKKCAHSCAEIRADGIMIQGLSSALSGFACDRNHQSPRNPWEIEAIAALSAQLPQDASPGINIVFFHVDLGASHPFLEKTASKHQAAAESIDYKKTLMLACEAARRTCSHASIYVLTDRATTFEEESGFAQILRLDADPHQMMYSRMRSYRALAMTGMLRGPILFLDTDVCLNAGFMSVFDDDFDIGLTYRSELGFWHMPVNEGVLLAKNADPRTVNQFFGECLDLYESFTEHPAVKARYDFSIKMWRGGQLSLGALTDWDVPPFISDRRDLRGVRYLFFPGIQFNYAVKSSDRTELLLKKRAVHFKGAQSKAAMDAYLDMRKKHSV